jgi:TRAP-type C4-dicarboxylate transport system permease small subunit
MPKHGKKFQQAAAKVDRHHRYTLEEAVSLVKSISYAKFDESVDVAVNLNVNPRHADQMVRGSVALPHGTGKETRVLVFAKGEKAKEATDAGADFVGAEELTRFMLICVVFVTLPFVVSSGASIRMEEILQSFPTRLRHGLRIAIAGTASLAFATASYSVGIATLSNLHNATPTLGIPYWVFFSAAFLGLLIAAIECAIQLVKIIRGRDQYVYDEADTPPGDEPTFGGY